MIPEPRELEPLILNPPLNPKRIRNLSDLGILQAFFCREHEVGFDVETNVMHDFYWRKTRTIQFGSIAEQYVIDLLDFVKSPDELVDAQGDYGIRLHLYPVLNELIHALEPVLCGRDHELVGVNVGFEYTIMYFCFGLRIQKLWDCSIVERCIVAGYHSLKDYSYFGMEGMMGRYFGVQIDKTLQTSFDLVTPLTDDQVGYAALDTRLPLGLRKKQTLIIQGKYIKDIDPILCGDNLERTCQLENDAIGAFQDMHLHGERLDKEKWNTRVADKKRQLKAILADRLDPLFVPLVGSKTIQVTQEQVDELHKAWKALSDDFKHQNEVELKAKIAKYRRQAPAIADTYRIDLLLLEVTRKDEKNRLKEIWNTKSKHLTAVRNLADSCEGDALINYGSGAQILKVVNEHFPEVRKRLGKAKGSNEYRKLESIEEDELAQFQDIPILAAIGEYKKLSKEINTYGDAWTMMWIGQDGPSKEHGWLHPGDGRLHCVFNQYEAETGRSSSSQPNAQNLPKDKDLRACFIADPPDEEEPEGYVLVTADMSGAELRILAELSGEPVWIEAFRLKQDVHCICCELMEEDWPNMALADCAFYNDNKKKCKCTQHNSVRDAMKPTNFGLPYGIGPASLTAQINEDKPKEKHKTIKEVKLLMRTHEQTFPTIWEYLDRAGISAVEKGKAFDMFGRRRLFPKPEWERARVKAMEYNEEKLRLPEPDQERNVANFILHNSRKPNPQEKWRLKHKMPSDKDIKDSMQGLYAGIERQGKNHEIQGTNASIAKVAMGAGYDKDGQPYLWHTLGRFAARLVKFVHDELVVQCPKRHGEVVAALIGDAFKRAAAEVMTKVIMEFEYHVETYWCK